MLTCVLMAIFMIYTAIAQENRLKWPQTPEEIARQYAQDKGNIRYLHSVGNFDAERFFPNYASFEVFYSGNRSSEDIIVVYPDKVIKFDFPDHGHWKPLVEMKGANILLATEKEAFKVFSSYASLIFHGMGDYSNKKITKTEYGWEYNDKILVMRLFLDEQGYLKYTRGKCFVPERTLIRPYRDNQKRSIQLIEEK